MLGEVRTPLDTSKLLSMAMLRKSSLSLVNLLLCLRVLPSYSYTSFVFGDSLVDAGNNDYIFTLSKADSPPYGIDFAPSGGQPTGRFTNGRTICDIVGQALGAKSFALPYLSPDTRGVDIFQGINYASGASGILNETGSLFIGRVPLAKQIDYFERSREFMVNTVTEEQTREFLKGAIFSITSGSNDILNYLDLSLPIIGRGMVSPTTLQDAMVSNMTIELRRLQRLGARKFIVTGVGPLGCIPFVRALWLLPSGRCSLEANKIVQGYNEKLSHKLEQLNQEMGPDAIFVFANSYNIVMDIIQNFIKYGFENVDDPCCGIAFPPFICYIDRNASTSKSSVVCNDRTKYVFWDAYHPTEAANIIIAKQLLDGSESVVSPINIRELHNYKL